MISIDCKNKELVGDYKNGGREWEPTGKPVEVQGHDFPDPGVPKAVPYGVYDIANNEGYVSVGLSAETAQFSVASIQAWWEHLGRERFRHARTADDHRRLRRRQQPSRAPVEGRAAAPRGRDRPGARALPLPALSPVARYLQ